jgi:hypothetical protein
MDTLEYAYQCDTMKKEFLEEAQLTRYMGVLGIGPMVYGSQTYSIRLSKRLMRVLGLCDTYSPDTMYFSIIVMERMDMSLYQYCIIYPDKHLVTIGALVVALLRRMANHGRICADLKPENIMINDDRNDITKLRFIDFGMDWCDTHQYIGHKSFRRYKAILGARQYRTFLFLLMLTTLGFNTRVRLSPHGLGEVLIQRAIEVMKRGDTRKVHLCVVDFWESSDATAMDFRTIVRHYGTDPREIADRYRSIFPAVDDIESSASDTV